VSRVAEHDVHILDGLAGSPFDQVVNGRYDDEPVSGLTHIQSDIAVVRSLTSSCWEVPFRKNPDKGSSL